MTKKGLKPHALVQRFTKLTITGQSSLTTR